jgi:hypothetical protein
MCSSVENKTLNSLFFLTATRAPPSGVCGKYFSYDDYMTCWELGGKCYCTDTCKRSNSNNAYCPYFVRITKPVIFHSSPSNYSLLFIQFWDWENAYEICLGQNMTLLNIETQEEDKRIDDYFQLNHGEHQFTAKLN